VTIIRRRRWGNMQPTEIAPYLSVIIPCWNEARNLEHGVLDDVHQHLTGQSYSWEVLVVDDGSTDDSRQLVEASITGKPGFRLLSIEHGGKPAAVWAGIQEAAGEIVLFTDMDQSTPISQLGLLLPWYELGFDVVIGSRGSEREGTSLLRKIGSVAFLALRRLFLLRHIRDTQCGFKTCRRKAALEVFPRLEYFREQERPSGWKVSAYDVELLYLFQRAGYRIKEETVSWQNRDLSDTKGQGSELGRYVNESVEMAREVLRVKLNQLRGVYDG
jgi:dolichyl-phosphate beta-glucosyltransferase